MPEGTAVDWGLDCSGGNPDGWPREGRAAAARKKRIARARALIVIHRSFRIREGLGMGIGPAGTSRADPGIHPRLIATNAGPGCCSTREDSNRTPSPI